MNLTTNDVNGDPVTVSKTAGPAFATLINGAPSCSSSPQAGDVAGSPYTVTLQASDGTDTSSVNVTVNVIAPGSAVYRINAGGPTLDRLPSRTTSASGRRRRPRRARCDVHERPERGRRHGDRRVGHVAGSRRARRSSSSARWPAPPTTAGNQMNWGFDLPNGAYNVTFYFGEQTSSTINAVGGRVFDVALEGSTVLDNYDMLAQTGGTKGVALEEDLPGGRCDRRGAEPRRHCGDERRHHPGHRDHPSRWRRQPGADDLGVAEPGDRGGAGQTYGGRLTTNDLNGDPVTVSKTSGPGVREHS